MDEGSTPVRLRVAVYVTRTQHDTELLVFEHLDAPEAGLQIPAGGVEQGETLVAAAAREVLEETGVRLFGDIRTLSVDQSPHPTTGEQRVTVYFHAQTLDQRDQWEHLVADTSGADEGMRFFCYFTTIDEFQLDLADSQGIFLGLLSIKPTAEQH